MEYLNQIILYNCKKPALLVAQRNQGWLWFHTANRKQPQYIHLVMSLVFVIFRLLLVDYCSEQSRGLCVHSLTQLP